MADSSGFTQSNDFVNSMKHMDVVSKSWNRIISSNFNDIPSQFRLKANVKSLANIYNDVSNSPETDGTDETDGIDETLTGGSDSNEVQEVGYQIADDVNITPKQAYYLGAHVNDYIEQNKPYVNSVYSMLSKCSMEEFDESIKNVDSSLSYYSNVIPKLRESLGEILNAIPSGSINYDKAFKTVNFDVMPALHKLQNKNILNADICI